MITIFNAQKRYHSNYGWSQAYRLFPSNSIHSDSIHELGNTNFGNIVIVNDYIVTPNFGFDVHPHQNLEQIFFIIEGALTHHDSLENIIVLKKNYVQRITAGSGYARSIHNNGKSPSRHIGVWLLPKTQNTLPAHDAREYDPLLWHNNFYPVASDMPGREGAGPPPIAFNAAATLYRATIDNFELSFPVMEGQKALLYIIDGDIDCNGDNMKTGYHARISGEEHLRLRSNAKSECIFVHMRADI